MIKIILLFLQVILQDIQYELINKRNITLPLGEVKITRKVKSFVVIFRSFTNENTLLSQNKKRLFEKQKKEYSLRSLNSICINKKNAKKKLKNINFFLKIIDDNSKPKVIKLIKKIALLSMMDELSNLDIAIKNPPRPYLAILGGAKSHYFNQKNMHLIPSMIYYILSKMIIFISLMQ